MEKKVKSYEEAKEPALVDNVIVCLKFFNADVNYQRFR